MRMLVRMQALPLLQQCGGIVLIFGAWPSGGSYLLYLSSPPMMADAEHKPE